MSLTAEGDCFVLTLLSTDCFELGLITSLEGMI